MAQLRHLEQAPITEAVIDLRIKPLTDLKAEDFFPLRDKLSADYPKPNMLHISTVSGEWSLGKGMTVAGANDQFRGLRLDSEDEKNIVQFRVDGFTFSRLKPYTNWEEIYNEAMRLWREYKAFFKPEMVTRIAVRYINHMSFFLTAMKLEEYFHYAPQLPEELPQELEDFLSRVIIKVPEIEAAATITQSLEQSIRPGEIRILLDIDAFKMVELDADSESIPDVLRQLRQLKNRIFFGSITEKTARLYE